MAQLRVFHGGPYGGRCEEYFGPPGRIRVNDDWYRTKSPVTFIDVQVPSPGSAVEYFFHEDDMKAVAH
jgi:hypothetical protein